MIDEKFIFPIFWIVVIIILAILVSAGFLLIWHFFLALILIHVFMLLFQIYGISVKYNLISLFHYFLLLLSIYFLLIVVFFSAVYCELGKTSEIDGIVDAESGKIITDHSTCLYFSVVTFTTLGYGDLKPIGVARGIAAFEAFVGYLSMGLLIGVVVYLLTHREKKSDEIDSEVALERLKDDNEEVISSDQMKELLSGEQDKSQ